MTLNQLALERKVQEQSICNTKVDLWKLQDPILVPEKTLQTFRVSRTRSGHLCPIWRHQHESLSKSWARRKRGNETINLNQSSKGSFLFLSEGLLYSVWWSFFGKHLLKVKRYLHADKDLWTKWPWREKSRGNQYAIQRQAFGKFSVKGRWNMLFMPLDGKLNLFDFFILQWEMWNVKKQALLKLIMCTCHAIIYIHSHVSWIGIKPCQHIFNIHKSYWWGFTSLLTETTIGRPLVPFLVSFFQFMWGVNWSLYGNAKTILSFPRPFKAFLSFLLISN